MNDLTIKHLEDILDNLNNGIYNNMFEEETEQDIDSQIYYLSEVIKLYKKGK